MTGLTEDKIAVLRQLVLTAPDPVIRGLESVLAEGAAAGPLASIRALVETEAADRFVRNTVLSPVEPLFGAPPAEGRRAFPRRALTLVWRGLKAERPDLMRDAAMSIPGWDIDQHRAPESFDELCAQAAQGLRAGVNPDFAAAAELCNAALPDGAAELAGCLDLAPIVRPALVRLGEWVARMNKERTATVRLAYRDAVAVADDAGPRFFEMLAGRLSQPWLILRIISAVMDRPTERYLASSELASFGTRILADIDVRITAVRTFDPAGGPAAGRRAGELVHDVTAAIAEFEESIQLAAGAPWAQAIAKQRKALAASVEQRLREVDEQVALALPLQAVRFGARLVKGAPKLAGEPNALAVGRALGLLAFADEVRASASSGGFGSMRAKVLEALDKRLDLYIEDLLDRIRAGDAEDPDLARRYLDVAAGFMAFCRDERAAQIVRRRAAAA